MMKSDQSNGAWREIKHTILVTLDHVQNTSISDKRRQVRQRMWLQNNAFNTKEELAMGIEADGAAKSA